MVKTYTGPLVSRNLDRVAMILVEASFFGDKQAAEKWGISPTTVANYRRRLNLNTDKGLVELFDQKRQEFENNWTQKIPLAIMAGTDALIKAFQEADLKDPAVIHSIAGAMKIMTEIGLAKEVIDVRLGKFDRPDGEQSDQVVTISSARTSEDNTS